MSTTQAKGTQYPNGFFAKGLDGRIDDPKTGWKGKGLWSTWATRTPFHNEGGKTMQSKVVHSRERGHGSHGVDLRVVMRHVCLRCYSLDVGTWRTSFVFTAVMFVVALAAFAQRPGGFLGGLFRSFRAEPNVAYDGRFTFVRVKYETAPGGYWWRGMPSWAHGYPLAEQNLMKIMKEVSLLDARDEAINTLTLDDPELFKYPIAYIIEVSWWTLTDREAEGLRSYLQKGGFLIVDDFKRPGDFGSPGWEPFEANMRRVLPDVRFYDMKPSHPIFHAFFEIDDLDIVPQAYNAGKPAFRGVFEDNDPEKRLQIIVNYNTDVSQFWEWSGTGLRPIDQTNEAYKLGVNYLVYGLTH